MRCVGQTAKRLLFFCGYKASLPPETINRLHQCTAMNGCSTNRPAVRKCREDHPGSTTKQTQIAKPLFHTGKGGDSNICDEGYFINYYLLSTLAHFGKPARFVDVTQDDVTEGFMVRPLVRALLNIAGKGRRMARRSLKIFGLISFSG